MKIIKCHIEGFGGLLDKTFVFNGGINSILAENGYGKTTLLAFIKAMLFGLPRTAKRSLEENEREKYFPWQGGSYGGFLEFAVQEKSYRAERFFYAKGGDRFALYDLQTNLPSKDYSERLGEELFLLDAASFEKSCYLPQRQVELQMTDSISAKAGSIVESGSPESFETALALLEKSMKRYALKRGEGGLIHQTETELDDISLKILALEEQCRLKEKLRQEEQSVKAEEEAVKEKLAAAALSQKNRQNSLVMKERWASYQSLLQRGKEAKEEYERLAKLHGGALPSESAVAKAEEWHSRLSMLEQGDFEDVSSDLNRLKAFFGGNLPEKALLEQAGSYCSEYLYREKRLTDGELCSGDFAEWQELKAVFPSGVPKEQELALLNKRKKGGEVILLCTALFLLLAGGGLFAVQKGLYGGIFAAVGAVCLLLGGIGFLKGRRERKNALLLVKSYLPAGTALSAEVLWQKRRRYLALAPEMERIEKSRAEEQQELIRRKTTLENFFSLYYSDLSPGFAALLEDIRRKRLQYDLLTERKEQHFGEWSRRAEEQKTLRRNIAEFLARYNESALDEKTSLARLKEDAIAGRQAEELSAALLQQAEQYRTEKNAALPVLPADDEIKDESLLLKELSLLTERKQALSMKAEQLARSAEQLIELTERQKRLQAVLAEHKKQYWLLGETAAALQKARDSLQGGYVRPIEERFLYYLSVFNGCKLPANVDAKLNITVEQGGERKKYGYFSKGYRDMMAICLRLALIDVLYRQEKPPLILDDPFVNLDDRRLKEATALLQRLSANRQVIYLTCHSSREID